MGRDILFKTDDYVFSYRVGGILIQQDKILLQKPKNDDYAIIGGHVAFGESTEDTLKREFEEELHVRVEVDKLIAVGEIFFPWGTKPCHQIALYYKVHLADESAIPSDGVFHGFDELDNERIDLDFCWVPLEKLKDGLKVYPLELIPYILKEEGEIAHFVSRDICGDLLSRFTEMSKGILGDNLVGVYLHGSAAMGCFNPKESDLDLMLVVEHDVSDREKKQFMEKVVKLNEEAPPKGLEFSIVKREFCKPFVYPTPFELHFSKMHIDWFREKPEEYVQKMKGTDKDLAAHFTIIRKYGKVLYGEEIDRVFGEVPREDYIDSIRADIEEAREDIWTNPMYITLNLCRVLAYLRENLILSKKEGGEWGLNQLPERFHKLICEALLGYVSDGKMEAPETALAFADYMLGQIEQYGTEYRTLCEDELCRELFRDFVRHQKVTKCWRKENGQWLIKDISFTDDWSEKEYETLVTCLKHTVSTGGFVYAAFVEGKLKGFTSVEPELFGGEQKYLDLSCIHVSEDMRGRGIGKTLFLAAKDWARQHGGRKLYISAHSAVESQAFYKAMGCVEAQVYNRKHVEEEPCDCQLECGL